MWSYDRLTMLVDTIMFDRYNLLSIDIVSEPKMYITNLFNWIHGLVYTDRWIIYIPSSKYKHFYWQSVHDNLVLTVSWTLHKDKKLVMVKIHHSCKFIFLLCSTILNFKSSFVISTLLSGLKRCGIETDESSSLLVSIFH